MAKTITKPAANSIANSIDKLLACLEQDLPELQFTAGTSFCWSPATRQVIYNKSFLGSLLRDSKGSAGVFSLLHETGHALLGHTRYRLDFELLELEVAAWQRAKLLAEDYGIAIDVDHIEDCLDSYRDWLYGRSICPSCTTKALQLDDQPEYRCYNCHASWKVTASRFCRPYRKSRLGATGHNQAEPVFSAIL